MRNRVTFKKSDWQEADGSWNLSFACPVVYAGDLPFLEIEAAQPVSVKFNGSCLVEKRSGLLRIPVDRLMKAADNELEVIGDVEGISLLLVPKSHFYVPENGEPLIRARTRSLAEEGTVMASGTVKDAAAGDRLKFTLYDPEGCLVDQVEVDARNGEPVALYVNRPRLWQANEPADLYYLSAQLIRAGKIRDEAGIPCGLRSFGVDADGSFTLNGCRTALFVREVDRQLNKDELNELKKSGVNCLYLKVHQNDPLFYTRCDASGIVLLEKLEDASLQVALASDHPSVCFWVADDEKYPEMAMIDPTRLVLPESQIRIDQGRLDMKMAG